jgi:hypothetical protein
MEESEIIICNNKDIAIVCFGGFALKMHNIPPYDFLNFLTSNFKNVDKYFYRDMTQMCYHHGIQNISTDINTTVSYLKNKLNKYKKVIMTGTSAGAYAAILFGSLLNVSDVIVFNPITILYGRRDKYNLKYIDLSIDVINKTTNYYLYGDMSITDINDTHHIKHCTNISNYINVNIIYKNGINLKQMKDSGDLFIIYNYIINS